jgi:hypothetical protein
MSRDALAEIEQGRTVRYDSAPIDFSSHSLARTNERYLRRLDTDRAEHELYQLLSEATVTREAPPWAYEHGHRMADGAAAWLVLERLQLCWPLRPGSGRRRGSLIAGTLLRHREQVGANVTVLQGTQKQRER